MQFGSQGGIREADRRKKMETLENEMKILQEENQKLYMLHSFSVHTTNYFH